MECPFCQANLEDLKAQSQAAAAAKASKTRQHRILQSSQHLLGEEKVLRMSGSHPRMDEITRILSTLDEGDSLESGELLTLVYDELRKLAASRLKQEKPGQTLQATALVHEAYLRLVGPEEGQRWANRAHFFAAAAEAMRRDPRRGGPSQAEPQTRGRPGPPRPGRLPARRPRRR